MKRTYIDHFFSLYSAADILPLFRTGNQKAAKEITESYACRDACAALADVHDPDVVAIVVGDGIMPRTAGLIAYTTKWTCHSIDPQMRLDEFEMFKARQNLLGYPVQRLHVYKTKAEDVSIDCGGKRTLVVLPHSHCDTEEAAGVARNPGLLSIVSLPCCVKPKPTKNNPAVTYVDTGVWSPQNQIYIWQEWKAA